MSYKMVLVATKEYPTEAVIDQQLQPFHEYHSDSDKKYDKYVQNINILDEAKEGYLNGTTECYKSADGTLYDIYESQFYRYATPEELQQIKENDHDFEIHYSDRYSRKDQIRIRYLPEGYEKVTLKYKDVISFAEYIERYYEYRLLPILDISIDGFEMGDGSNIYKTGWYKVNKEGEVVEVIDRTIPDAKWDWWNLEPGSCERFYVKGSNKLRNFVRKSDVDWDRMLERNKKEPYCADMPTTPALLFFARLMNGEWIEKGDMGWWGIVSDENEDWYNGVSQKLIDDIPDDYYMTIVYTHI
jgi:hypothetical protein